MSEQAVVKTNGESMTSSADNNALDGLDSLLDEFGSEPKEAQGGQTDVAKRLEALETELQNERYNKEITSIAGKIRGDSDHPLLEDGIIISYLENKARQDSRVATAWMKRHENPEAFEKIVQKIGEELHSKVKATPNPKLTANRDALESAVRASSTSTQQTKEVDWASLSDAEFQQEKMKLLAG